MRRLAFTDRDLALAQRDAYQAGARAALAGYLTGTADAEAVAEQRYPIPDPLPVVRETRAPAMSRGRAFGVAALLAFAGLAAAGTVRSVLAEDAGGILTGFVGVVLGLRCALRVLVDGRP